MGDLARHCCIEGPTSSRCRRSFGWLSHQAPPRPSCPNESGFVVAHLAGSHRPDRKICGAVGWRSLNATLPAEGFLSLDRVERVNGGRTLGVVAAIRRALSQGPMRPVAVVVLDEVLEHEAHVPLVDNQGPVGTSRIFAAPANTSSTRSVQSLRRAAEVLEPHRVVSPRAAVVHRW
jgi:hypothetical protein